jgi:hypothetical protein
MRNFHILFGVLIGISLLLTWLSSPVWIVATIYLAKLWLCGMTGYWIAAAIVGIVRACKQ